MSATCSGPASKRRYRRCSRSHRRSSWRAWSVPPRSASVRRRSPCTCCCGSRVNALFADALVQRSVVDDAKRSPPRSRHRLSSACVAAVLQVALRVRRSPSSLGDGRLTADVGGARAAAAAGRCGWSGAGLLTRERAYRTLALRTLIGQGLGHAGRHSQRAAGAGAWALVVQQLVTSAAGALALLAHARCGRIAPFSRQRLREMLRIGLPLTASTLVQHGRYRLFALLIGGTAGAAALGQVHMAFRLVDTVRELAFTAQWRLMLPLLSERQDDLPALRAGMDRCLAWSSILAFPLCAVMAVTVQPLVASLLGPVWQPSGEAALPLIALTAWLFLAFPAGRRRHRSRRDPLRADRQHRRHRRDRVGRPADPARDIAARRAGVAGRAGVRQSLRAADQRAGTADAGAAAAARRRAAGSLHRCCPPSQPSSCRWRSASLPRRSG